jgi:glycosyltransferase involved in cell wall biosynthesis
VSAHYPPNFVSGGTLQPKRLARGLADRGHDVRVYAGWLGDERPPGERWTTTEDGIEVRWTAVTPWTDWSDERNFENAAIEADFSRFLSEVDPEVVHLHSLQALGAGLASAAVAAGIPTVVTMHDFWWFCGRQFLVDRDFQPCCPVVDAGVCECHVDRAWLERRNRRLLAVANSVDLVLAPSKSAAELLAANGVDPARLAVDENGLVQEPEATHVPADDRQRLVFLYAGGSNLMKGVHVLFDALDRLARAGPPWRRPWTVRAYGVEDYVQESGISTAALPVECLPPFPPDEADAVYGAADVLVLPSVMRESHS